jgi:hypothetical protein
MTDNHDHSRDRSGFFAKARETSRQSWETIRRAFVEFLKIPTLVIAGFLLLALVMFVLDEARIANQGNVDARNNPRIKSGDGHDESNTMTVSISRCGP